jgi:hypothetical protein
MCGLSLDQAEKIRAFRQEICQSVNDLLEDSRRKEKTEGCFWVLGGDEPTEADAIGHGFIVSCLVADAGPESKELVQTQFPAVIQYAQSNFPDYEIWA